MAQVTEDLVRSSLARCERGEFPPLTTWEVQQLLHAWIAKAEAQADFKKRVLSLLNEDKEDACQKIDIAKKA